MKKILADNLERRVVFMDSEFTGLSATGTKMLSVAFITDTGKELYLEIDQTNEDADSWVKENVIPLLKEEKVSEEEAKERIKSFIKEEYGEGDNLKPIMVSDVNQFDWMGVCGLFGVRDVPFFYIPMDLTAMLWKHNIDLDINRFELAEKLGVDVSTFKQHNALEDTKVLKATWEVLETK